MKNKKEFKIPTHEELKKIFKIKDGKGICHEIPKEKYMEIIGLMKSLFKCKGCGNCCKICKNISWTKMDFDKISKYLQISHSELKRRYKFKFGKKEGREVRLMGDCPFLNNENKCDIYEVRPHVCKQFPFTTKQIRPYGDGFVIEPVPFCYPHLSLLWSMFIKKRDEELDKFIDDHKEMFDGLREKLAIAGINKINQEDEGI